MLQPLQSLVASFPARPMLASREMRRLLDSDRNAFRQAALTLLKQKGPQAGHQHLLTLLVNNGLVVDRLADPRFLDAPDAIEMARRIQNTIDSTLDVRLVRLLFPANGAPPAVTGDEPVLRILEIVGAISDGARVITLLSRLLQHPAAKVRSKAALLIGRMNRNLKWVEARLTEPDARVRANSVESLWGLNSPEARQMFRAALEDPDNRVAGNGAIGLYRCGDPGVAEVLVNMLGEAEPKLRATAAWAMGESADPRFLGPLTARLTDPDSIVRQNVFRSVGKIRVRVQETQQKPPLRVVIARAGIAGDSRKLELAVLQGDAQPVAGLHPLDFVVTEKGMAMTRYNVVARQEGEHVAAGFVLPRDVTGEDAYGRSMFEGLRSFLRYKRDPDGWAAVKYRVAPVPAVAEFRLDKAMLTSGSGGGRHAAASAAETGQELEPIRFSSESRSIVHSFETMGLKSAACEGPAAAARRLLDAMAHMRGHRYLFVFLHRAGAGDWADLLRRASKAEVAIYALSSPDPIPSELRRLCQETGGDAVTVKSPEDLPAACERLAASLVSLYSIDYPLPLDGSGKLKVQIYSDLGFGEDTIETA